MSKIELDYKLNRIGFQLWFKRKGKSKEWIDLEQTVIDACYEAENDGRLLSVLFTWAKVHGRYLISEKLGKLYLENQKYRGEAPIFYALCSFLVENGQHKFKKFIKKVDEDFVPKWETKASLKMKGAIYYLESINIFLSEGSIRIRKSDILSVEQLVKENLQYKNRLLFGANVRADIITAIQMKLGNPYQISKILFCSYESARRIVKEYQLSSV